MSPATAKVMPLLTDIPGAMPAAVPIITEPTLVLAETIGVLVKGFDVPIRAWSVGPGSTPPDQLVAVLHAELMVPTQTNCL